MEKIEALGYILKKETLATLHYPSELSDLVLEDMAPYPGYYDLFNIPRTEKELLPQSIFFVVRSYQQKEEDDMIRVTQRIKAANPDYVFDAVFGNLTVLNEPANCIRLYLKDLDLIPKLLDAYRSAGAIFARHRQIPNFTSLIKLRKFFEMEALDQGLYKDKDQPDTYYLEMPVPSDWDTFYEVYQNIKHSFEFKYYDAAIGSFYRKCGLIDFIRLYSPDASLSQLSMLRDKFRSELVRRNPS
ncbi:MAG TPA: hypothetical protein PLE85_10520 [Bacteroidales bacterium]|nr:hypothetical protein [Bacteroidales bacterium]